MSNIDLRHCDCFDGLKDVRDESIDMILTDMPYGVLNKKNPHAGWDKEMPLPLLWEHFCRVIKPNGAIVLFGQGIFSAKLILSNERLFRYSLVWDKKLITGFLNANRMPLRRHEDILVFYKSLPTYNPQMVRCEPHRRNHSRGNLLRQQTNRCYGDFVAIQTTITDEKYPTSIISIAKNHINGKAYHPTEKPVELLRWLIRTYTNEGETILDPFMGSGSTGVACKKEHRKFVGMEIEQKFYDIAKMRVSSEYEQLKLEFQ